MRTKHKVPSLVSMWMLDVFCCALGCVTLLFLFESYKATDIAETQNRKIIQTVAHVNDLKNILQEKDNQLHSYKIRIQALEKQIDQLDSRYKEQLLSSGNKIDYLHNIMTQIEAELDKIKAEKSQLEHQMKQSDDRYSKLMEKYQVLLDQLDKERTEVGQLKSQIDRLQQKIDKLFGGILISGKKVAFLVDMSGSMGKQDEKTDDPNKWRIVTDTIERIMRMASAMEFYQVIVFSGTGNCRWLFEDNGNWRKFRGEESIQEVIQKLKAIKPEGDTNLYQAFELAFSLSDLDTIYLFSDGLPTSGPLPPGQPSAQLSESEKSVLLGKHVLTTLRDKWNRKSDGTIRVRIHSIGFYFDSPNLGSFLWELSRANSGSFIGMNKP